MARAVILDFDGSVSPLDGAQVVPLRHREEAVRFACRMRVLRELAPLVDAPPGVVFMGSGDFHHVSYVLIERLRRLATTIQVVVFDNHPDNMRYPFGIHCGSWVWHVSRLPFVARVHVAGISSSDVEGLHAWENHLAPLRRGVVNYWCVQRNPRLLRRFGARAFDSAEAMLSALHATVESTPEPIYLSIDKDVLSLQDARTNWDQGVMRVHELENGVTMLRERVIAADVVGDVSAYRYRSRFKRFLSRLDGQPEIPGHALGQWRAQHARINERLLSLFDDHFSLDR